MNTNNIKKYAPKARNEFMNAVAKRLNTFGISADKKGTLLIADATVQGSVFQVANNTFDVSLAEPRQRLVQRAEQVGYAQLIEQVAYTWFNRLCALRYMEIHDYLGHGFRVLSHPSNAKGFELLDHAQDGADELGLDKNLVVDLKLAGNKDEELYRELLLGQCHKLHEAMPFLFDALDDETELLLPDNLTRTDSILRGLVDGIPEEDWQQVEVIGWLYQFYISEKKDQVIGKVVKSEDIPAATQLFTPNWIVKYLVQNSVGRQWLQTYPDSAIKTQMEYYIEPAEQSDEVNQQLKAITPLSSNGEGIEPETIKVLDPACGSGHILIEAYNVLKAIYEERGFRSRDIPKMILENNLYGLDIDDRAAQLSGFALMMMARDDDKRIFTRNVRLNVLSLQESNHIDLPTLWKALNLSGSWQSGTSQGLFTELESTDEEQDLSSFNADNRYQLLKRTLARFTQAKTFGSLIDVPSDDHDQLKELLSTLVELHESGDSMQKPAAKQLIEVIHQALVLSIRYDAVIANPPYMGAKGMNADLKDFAKTNFPNSKSDLFAIFIERGFGWLKKAGLNSMVTMQSWMFLSSYEQMRDSILSHRTIENMVHMGNGVMKIAFGTNATIFRNIQLSGYKGFFSYADNEDINEDGVPFEFPVKNERLKLAASDDFKKIPGSPIAYWADPILFEIYQTSLTLKEQINPKQGMATGDNDRFLRYWWEVKINDVSSDSRSKEELWSKGKKYARYNKGGEYCKWYGNNEILIRFDEAAYRVLKSQGNHCPSENLYFKKSLTWSDITTKAFAARYSPEGAVFDVKGSSGFPTIGKEFTMLALLCSDFINYMMAILNPSVTFQVGDIGRVPFVESDWSKVDELSKVLVNIAKENYDFSELSLDFSRSKLIRQNNKISDCFSLFKDEIEYHVLSTRKGEDKLNYYINNIFGLDVPNQYEREITLKYNTEDERIDDILIRDLLSYGIGCILGRYSPSKSSVVYANSGNDEFEKLLADGAFATFPVDEDGIIPLTHQEWFKDDATNRFREFVQVVWGEEHLQENLDFVAESLCLNAIKPLSKKGQSESALETIRRYLSTQFYKDHLKTYKKRPIYWLFSSGKQKAFECLVYLHRYNEGTLSRMRTEYVTPLLGKYDAYAEQLEKQIETADSTSEANRFKKELDALIKKQVELREFDDKLKHYADMRISLDLDDGVKVNYGKFGDLLADVKGVTGSAPEVK